MSESQLSLSIPPTRFVRQLASRLDSGVPRNILDVGCGTGRHSWYLAKLGHSVLGIANDFSEVRGAISAGEEGYDCNFIVGDARHLPVRRSFDIVLGNEFLHLMAKKESRRTLGVMRSVTVQGGINAVSGYVLEPGTGNATNSARMFSPDELQKDYAAAGWDILEYHEDYKPISNTSEGKEWVHSIAQVIAQRPW